MKRYVILILFALTSVLSAMSQSVTNEAEAAYAAERYDDAISLYLQSLKTEGVSSDLYYNLGNCYYRSGDLGYAIYYYEKALLLNPNNEEARTNLNFVNEKQIDKLADDENIVDAFLRNFMSLTTANGWAKISIISFIAFLLTVALYIFSGSIILRKTGFFGGCIILFICIIANVIAVKTAKSIEYSDYAIVIKKSTTLSTSPREPRNAREEAFVLHEGAKVQVLDSVETKIDSTTIKWFDVQADDAHRAWIKGTDFIKL